MKLVDFLEQHQIQWQPVILKSKGQGRQKLPTFVQCSGGGWLPKMTDFYGPTRLSSEEFQRRKDLFPGTVTTIAIDTTVVQQVDIDDETLDLTVVHEPVRDLAIHMIQCKRTPWYKSLTKQLPHIFVRLETPSGFHGKRTTANWNDRIDVLCGQWSYAQADAEVFCAEEDIQQLPDTYTRAGFARAQTDSTRLVHAATMTNAARVHDVTTLLALLSTDRVRVYGQWLEVGIVLKCMGGAAMDDEEMFQAWVDWSSQVPLDGEADEGRETHAEVCQAKWDTFSATGKYSVGTLHYMAKLDSPAQYAAQFSGVPARRDAESLSVEAQQIAEFLVRRHQDNYATIPVPGGGFIWYQFFGHRWYEIGQTPSSFINQVIGDEFVGMLESLDPDEPASDNKLMEAFPQLAVDAKNVDKLRRLVCGSYNTMMSVVKYAATRLLDATFENRLDCAHNLICFENGVYDLDVGVFRDGRPEDMVSISTGYDYTDTIDTERRETILEFKRAITGSQEMFDYLMDIEAYSLHGDTWIQNMYIHTGTGGNGKSVNGILLRKAFGGYFYAPDVTLFTGKRSMVGGTSSELAKAKGKRLLLSTEPEAGDTLQAARIKYFTGGEVIQARPLYKSPVEFQPQFTIHLQMNQLPNLSNFDGGVARRLKVVPYPYQFVSNPTLEHHRPMDTGLGKKFNTVEYAQQFMLLLLEHFKSRLAGEQAISYPQAANEVTEEYMEDEDVIGDFVRVHIVRTGNPADKVDASLLYASFKDSGFSRPDISQTLFGRKMKDHGLRKKRTSRGVMYVGIKLATGGTVDPVDAAVPDFV